MWPTIFTDHAVIAVKGIVVVKTWSFRAIIIIYMYSMYSTTCIIHVHSTCMYMYSVHVCIVTS